MKTLATLFCFFSVFVVWHCQSIAQTTVFLKPADALKLIFKDSQEVAKEDHAVSVKDREKAQQNYKVDLPKDLYSFYVGKTNGKIDGYALIDDQVGKVQPITFVSKISLDGKIEQVEIMVYRESHGGEVASKRFLNQFKGKSLNNEIRLHGSITNVTGATLSSQALVTGSRRALALWNLFYGKP